MDVRKPSLDAIEHTQPRSAAPLLASGQNRLLLKRAGDSHFESTLPGMGERRRLERRRMRVDVYIQPRHVRYQRQWAVTEDICHRGIFICTEGTYPLEALLELSLCTDHGEITLSGRVVHRLEGIGFGCEFCDLSERQKAILGYLVALTSAAPHAIRRLH